MPLLLVVAFFVPALVVVVVHVVVALEMVLIVLLLGLACLVPHQNLLDLYVFFELNLPLYLIFLALVQFFFRRRYRFLFLNMQHFLW